MWNKCSSSARVIAVPVSQEGPHISWQQLTSFQSCREGMETYSCAIFSDRTPRTISMTVGLLSLVMNC